MRYHWIVLALGLFVAPLSGCGSESTDAVKTTVADTQAQAATETGSACEEPDGTEKGALRFAVRSHDRELKDSPWVLVQNDGVNFMAAEIDEPGPRLVVLVSFPEEGDYLSGMKAINGTARTFTDLPDGGDPIPKGGEQALDCIG